MRGRKRGKGKSTETVALNVVKAAPVEARVEQVEESKRGLISYSEGLQLLSSLPASGRGSNWEYYLA
jgi:hypothetical protein